MARNPYPTGPVGHLMRHTVEAEAVVLDVLQAMHPQATRNTLRRMLSEGRVRIDGQVERRAQTTVTPGQEIQVDPRKSKPQADKDRGRKGVRVLYEDARLLVADKPHGLLTVATDKGDKDTLYDRLFEREKEAHDGRIFIVHRLDRPTSGVILFAKDEETKERLQAMFAARKVERIYHVLVEGIVEPDQGTSQERLQTSESLQVYITPSGKQGKKARTDWKVLKRGPRHTLVEARLGTGRRHQIRVHMAHLGHPVVGDKEHGPASDPIGRLGLHAHALAFEHPWTHEPVRIESPTPPRFLRVLGLPVEPTDQPEAPRRPRRKKAGRGRSTRPHGPQRDRDA